MVIVVKAAELSAHKQLMILHYLIIQNLLVD